jgi:hypothetical protein
MVCGITYDFERTVGSLQSKRLIRCWTKVGTAKPIANPAELLSHLAMAGVFLNKKEAAIAEAKRAVEMSSISKDALDGPAIAIKLTIVYAWNPELDMAFETLGPLSKTPASVYYGQLKRDLYWDPLRKDPRFDKLLAELAPRDWVYGG